MFTDIYLVECIMRNTRTMQYNVQSKLFRPKAFENLNDAMYYYFLIKDSLELNGFEFVVDPDFIYNSEFLRKKSLPSCKMQKDFRYYLISVKLIPLMKES